MHSDVRIGRKNFMEPFLLQVYSLKLASSQAVIDFACFFRNSTLTCENQNLINQKWWSTSVSPAQSQWFAEERDCRLQHRGPWRTVASDQGLCWLRSVLWRSWWCLPCSCHCQTEKRSGTSVSADGSMQVDLLEIKRLSMQAKLKGPLDVKNQQLKDIPRGLAATAAMMVGTSWFFTLPWQGNEHALGNHLLLSKSHVEIFSQGRHVLALGQCLKQDVPLRRDISLSVPGTWSLNSFVLRWAEGHLFQHQFHSWLPPSLTPIR